MQKSTAGILNEECAQQLKQFFAARRKSVAACEGKSLKWNILRTPDSRFENLPGYPFAPNFVDDLPSYAGIRIHFVDVGPRDATKTFFVFMASRPGVIFIGK